MSGVQPTCDHNSALDLVSDAVLARLDGPPEKVRGLPNEAFTSQAFFELEQQTLFTRCWSFAGVASELPEVGDVRPVEVAGQPLLLIRGADRHIRVFHNVCPHRGAKLIDEPANRAKGLTCVYHAWSYGLDGRLRARPHYNGPGRHGSGAGDDADAVCLFPVRSHTWYDWVFVNLDGKAPPFESYLGEAAAHFDGYDLSALRLERHITTEFACNWKLAFENACDYYHVFKIHSELDQIMGSEARGSFEIAGRHLLSFTELRTSLRPVSRSGGSHRPQSSRPPEGHGIPPESNTRALPALPVAKQVLDAGVFPNMLVQTYPSNGQFYLFEPVSVDRCILHQWLYYIGDGAEDEACRASRDKVCAEYRRLNAQDADACRSMQEGRRGAYDGGRLAPYWDQGTVHFHKMVAHAVRGDGPFAPVT